jgi:site-specific recombinase XerD
MASRKYPAETLTKDEARRIIAQPTNCPTGIRDRALMAVMYRGALRISEVLGLEPRDIDLNERTVRVRNGKSGPKGGPRMRVVGIDGEAVSLVERWLDIRRQRNLGRAQFLFCTLKGKPLSQPATRAMLRRRAAKAGVDRRVHPHMFRHTRAAEMAAEGVPVNVIQRALGHHSLGTTSIYLDHVAPQQVIAAMSGADWKLDPEAEAEVKAERDAEIEELHTILTSATARLEVLAAAA